jgi:glycerate-2-kinase
MHGERLAQQLVTPQLVAFAFSDVAGDEQNGEVAR